MPVYMSGKEDIWEKACQITTRRGLKADSHCVGIREAEEALAHIREWDFSHVDNRYSEEGSLPWDYRKIILLGDRDYLLDMDTGRGEFLLSLGHPYSRTSAAEAYPLNVELCPKVLVPLGIDFREAPGNLPLPFPGMKLKEQSKKLK